MEVHSKDLWLPPQATHIPTVVTSVVVSTKPGARRCSLVAPITVPVDSLKGYPREESRIEACHKGRTSTLGPRGRGCTDVRDRPPVSPSYEVKDNGRDDLLRNLYGEAGESSVDPDICLPKIWPIDDGPDQLKRRARPRGGVDGPDLVQDEDGVSPASWVSRVLSNRSSFGKQNVGDAGSSARFGVGPLFTTRVTLSPLRLAPRRGRPFIVRVS